MPFHTLRLLLSSTGHPDFEQASVAMKSMWQAVGVDTVIEALEDATIAQRVFTERDFDVAIASYTITSDPAFGVARAFVTSSIGKLLGNPSNYSNPRVDSLFEEAERGVTQQERGKPYKEVQVILAEDLPMMTLRQFQNLDAASIRLKGLWGVAHGTGKWADAWLVK